MFKRWLILLVAFLALEIAAFAYLAKQVDNTFFDCSEYLQTLPNDWKSADDKYFWMKCDYDNPVSDSSLAIKSQDKLETIFQYIILTFMATLGVLLISLISRWIFAGRLR